MGSFTFAHRASGSNDLTSATPAGRIVSLRGAAMIRAQRGRPRRAQPDGSEGRSGLPTISSVRRPLGAQRKFWYQGAPRARSGSPAARPPRPALGRADHTHDPTGADQPEQDQAASSRRRRSRGRGSCPRRKATSSAGVAAGRGGNKQQREGATSCQVYRQRHDRSVLLDQQRPSNKPGDEVFTSSRTTSGRRLAVSAVFWKPATAP